MFKKIVAIAAVGVSFVASAFAGTSYEFEVGNTQQRRDVGQIEYLSIAYDTDERLKFSARLGQSNTVANGGWLVISPNENPKNASNELAILYFDFAGGDIYAYRYDGRRYSNTNGQNSYRRSRNYITTYKDALSVSGGADGQTVSFDLDTSLLAPGAFGSNWTGVSFAETIGVWLHFTALDRFIECDDRIWSFKTGAKSWYDVTGKHTTKVSEPIGFAAAGFLMAGGLVAWRRRRQSQASTEAV